MLSRGSTRALFPFALVLATSTLACRRDKPEIHVSESAGESRVLPRVTRPMLDPSAVRSTPRTMDLGGRQRSYLVIEPSLREPGRLYPLVLAFHGDGGNASGFHHAWPFESASGKDAWVVYLDGFLATWDLETTIDNPDVSFVEAVVASLSKEAPIDGSRVFATGYSSGGFLANVLACQRPGLLRAIASHAGGAPYSQREKWPNGFPKCPGQQPVAALALHGERDFTVTLDSGRYTAEYWAYVDGCSATEMETTGYGECRTYRGCPEGKAVGFCSVPPLGHWVWSEGANAAWTFFERQ